MVYTAYVVTTHNPVMAETETHVFVTAGKPECPRSIDPYITHHIAAGGWGTGELDALRDCRRRFALPILDAAVEQGAPPARVASDSPQFPSRTPLTHYTAAGIV